MAARTGPLKGIKVIELAHVMAGPTCGLMLADMGADVIKVEKMPDGDDTRRFMPPDDRARGGRLHDDEPQQARHRCSISRARTASACCGACCRTPTC